MTLNIQRFQQRPNTVHAVFVHPDLLPEIADWCQGYVVETLKRQEDGQYVHVPVGIEFSWDGSRAGLEEWIVRARDGEFFAFDAEDFWAEFEYVGDVAHPDQPELPFGE